MTTPAGSEEATAQADRWRQIPTGWRPVSADETDETKSRVVDAIQAATTVDGLQRLERALAPASRHPVRLLELWPTDGAFNASDLLVIQLLGHTVSLETCLAIAGDDGANVQTIARHLRAVPIDRGACLADAATLLAMDALWTALFEALRTGGADPGDAEVAAHLLCARKSPRLFPASARIVKDRADAESCRRRAWQLHRFLDGDTQVRGASANLVSAARDYDRDLGDRLSGMWAVPLVELCTIAGEEAAC
jgi:hypothetical protein